MNPEMITQISAGSLIGVLLYMMFKYLTKDLSSELAKQYQIICDLIKAKNELVKEVNETMGDINERLNYIEGMLSDNPPRRARKR